MAGSRLNEENYEKMVKLTPGLLCISYLNGLFKYSNPAFSEILGYSEEEISHMNVFSIIHPDDISKVREYLSKASEDKKEKIKLEYRYQCKNGEYKWIAWNVKVDRDEGLVYGTGTDVTDMKNIEEELKKIKKRLLEAQEFASIGYWEYDVANKKLSWSDEVFKILGYKPQEFVPTAQRCVDIVHPDEKTGIKKFLFNVLHERIKEYEIKLIKADGTPIWIQNKLLYDYDQLGALAHIYGVSQDISKYKASEANLKESQMKYLEITSNIPTGIISYDKSGNIKYVNPKALEILGSPSVDATMAINLFSYPPLVECGVSEACINCIEEGIPVTVERKYITKWGKAIILRILATPLKDDNGKVISAITIIEDFTERKKLENELLVAKEQAELSNRAKSQFLANMSHEIRTPMNGILGMAQILQMSVQGEHKELIDIIKTSGDNLLKLINDILDLSKIEAGKYELSQEEFDINVLMNEVNIAMRTLVAKKGLVYKSDIDQEINNQLIGDADRLKQVLFNLLGNAIKFTDHGSIELSIKKSKAYNDKIQLVFSVTDTGIGIQEDKIDKLFNFFTQVDDSVTKKYGGTGLGLAISKELVNMMDGEISVESKPGVGSRFIFSAVFKLKTNAEEIEKEDAAEAYDTAIPDTCALLVEDDFVSSLVMKKLCERKNIGLIVANCGRQAIDIINEKSFDIIFMDIQMPDLSGYETTRIIRNLEKTLGRHTPIVATTAFAQVGDREKCMEAGMDDYLEKPISAESFYMVLEKYL